jgi:hypothetical protein
MPPPETEKHPAAIPAGNDDLIHDIAIPRYSALGTVTPNRIVLIGVYLLLGSSVLYAFFSVIQLLTDPTTPFFLRLLTTAFYFAAAAVGILLIIKVHRRYITHKRTAAGRCPTCGYDLRGTPTHCPECGSTPQPEKT